MVVFTPQGGISWRMWSGVRFVAVGVEFGHVGTHDACGVHQPVGGAPGFEDQAGPGQQVEFSAAEVCISRTDKCLCC